MANKSKLFDDTLVGTSQEALDFITNILESSTEYSIIGKDLNGKIVLWNEGARLIYGYAPEEVVGKANSDILHTSEDIANGIPKKMLEVALRGGKWEGTSVRVRKDGSRFTARVVITPRRDSTGKAIGFLLISKDITAEVRLAEELRKSKLFDNTVVGTAQEAVDFITNILESSTEYSIIGKDLVGKIVLWNEGARLLYGYDPDEVVGKANSSILHTPEDIASGKHKKILDEALRYGKWEGTLVRMRKDGSKFTARVVVTPRRDINGKPIGFLLISKDITEEIRLTEELKATQFYTRSLIESNIDALMTTDPAGIITDVNKQMEELTGISRPELIGSPFKKYFTDPQMAEEGIKLVLREGRVTNYELVARARDGRTTQVSYNASTFSDSQGRLQGVFAAARDITFLKQASQYARSLIEASLDPLVTISADGKITDVNEATIKITGVSRENLIGTDFANYFVEPQKAREGYKQVLAKGYVTDYPLTIRHVDGKLTDVLYNASVYNDVAGNVLGVFAAARDITAQKQASQYARSLIEASLDPLVTISPEGKITDVNEATIKVTGVSREKLIGTDFANYFTEPDKAREGYKQVLVEGYVMDYPLTIRHNDGKLTDVLYNASVYKDVTGNVLGVFAAARDITSQKQASQYARSLIEASLDPLVTISADGKITDVNEATIKATGVSRERLIGTDFANYFTEPVKAREGYQQVLARGFVTDYPLTIRHKNAKLTDVLYNASVYKDVSGNVLGVFAAARDVTAQRKAESQVADQRTKELERLAELERFQRLTVGRELKMMELKKEIEELTKKLGDN